MQDLCKCRGCPYEASLEHSHARIYNLGLRVLWGVRPELRGTVSLQRLSEDESEERWR